MTPTTEIAPTEPDLRARDGQPSDAGRYAEIARVLLKHAGREFVKRIKLDRFLPKDGDEADRPQEEKAKELAADLERLGPTFIKLGQLLSTRADLIPPVYAKELSRLQDNIASVPFAEIRAVIESELERPLSSLFTAIDESPLGAASLAQVHTACLSDGRPVAVKVRRPGVRDQVLHDLDVLENVVKWSERHSDTAARYGFFEIFDQFRRTLLRELDFDLEAQNLRRLRSIVEAYPELFVPEPVDRLTTSAVLTMDYVDGEKVKNLDSETLAAVDGERLADRLLRAYLEQVFLHGFFHADPHPGNVFLTAGGRLALVDLGMVGRFQPVLRRKLLRMVPAIYKMDADDLLELALDIGEPEPGFNKRNLRRALADVLERSQAGSLNEIGVSGVLYDVLRAAAQHGLRLPPEISLLGRTLLHLDAIGRLIAPNFDVNKAIERHVQRLIRTEMRRDLSPKSLMRSLMDVREFLLTLPRRADRLTDALLERRLGLRVDLVPEGHLLENLLKIANRITMGLVLAALIVGAALLMRIQTPFTLFGYPGFAMVCFAGAVVGGVALIIHIIRDDPRTSHAGDPEAERREAGSE